MIPQKEINKRIANMHRMGILSSDEVPTVWQVEQAGWVMQPGITRVNPYHEPTFGTWWSRMPQRLVLQALTGSGSKDGTGFARDTDSQIWHILTIHHYDVNGFGYDLEMLAGHDNGLEQMRADAKAMISGTHKFHWLAWQMIGVQEYWPRVLEATERFLDGDVSFDGPRVQATVDLALSFPKTPAETLAHPEAMTRHLKTFEGLAENLKDLLEYVTGIRKVDTYPVPEFAQTPTPLPAN